MTSNKLLALLLSLLILRVSSQSLIDQLLANPALANNPNFFNNEATMAYLAKKAKEESALPPVITVFGEWTMYLINGKGVNVSVSFGADVIKFTYCDEMKYKYTINGSTIKITADYERVVSFCRSGNGLFQDEVE